MKGLRKRRNDGTVGNDDHPSSSSSSSPFEVLENELELVEETESLDGGEDDDLGGAGWLGKGEDMLDRENENKDDENVDDPDAPSFWSQFKSVGPKLVPFFKTLGMYFVIFVPVDRPSWFAMLLKCLPVASLGLFVLLHGISLSDQHTFARRILAGLLFSCIGDAFLVWPAYFLHGLISFGIAQIWYILAFGFKPENMTLGIIIYGSTSIGLGLVMPRLVAGDTATMICVPIYIVLLTTMLWRAMSRVQFFEDLWTWTKLCSCFGGVFFAISDSVLGLNKFYAELPYSQVIIMGTYYLAQLGIALSVVNSKAGAPREDPENEHEYDDNDESGINRNWNKKDIWNIPGFEQNTIRGASRRAVDPDDDF